jgi:hypothetical protein
MKLVRYFISICFLGLLFALFTLSLQAQASDVASGDPCAGKTHCDGNKLFSAEVIQLTTSPVGGGRHHSVRMNIRFHNLTDHPLTLAYVSGSSVIVDNLGNRYSWGRPGTHDTSVQGIGIAAGRSVDTQFQLDPGESRNAVFQLLRYNSGRNPLGKSFNYDVTIAQFEILPDNKVRSVKQYSLTFPNLTEGLTAER